MKILLFILSSLFIQFLCFESNFELQYANWNEKQIISSLRNIYIEIDASFGSKMEKFKLALDLDSHAMTIPSVNCTIADENIKKFSGSTSFQTIGEKIFSGERAFHGILGTDDFKLGENGVIIKNTRFILADQYSSSQRYNYKYAFMGLKSSINDDDYNKSIIGQMKEKKFISDQIWFLNFNSDTKGNFVIGALPHTLYQNVYNESDMISQNCLQTSYLCILQFENIYLGKPGEQSSTDYNLAQGKFSINTKLFISTPNYGDYISNFFKKHKDACNQVTLDDNYISYYCQKDKFKIDEIGYLNFTLPKDKAEMDFIFEPKDLFYEKDGILYFLIIYKPNDQIAPVDDYAWTLGTTFLQKYLITFKRDEKSIVHFYTKKMSEVQGGDGDGNKSKYIIIIVVLSVVFLACIAFLIFYIIKIKPRKKKANELDDDGFDYQTKQNEEGNSALINE